MLLSEYIRVEQAKAIYSNLLLVVLGTTAVSIITAGILWLTHSKQQITLWLLVSITISFIRWLTLRKFNKEKDLPTRAQFWLNYYVFWAVISGINWGMASIFFYSSEFPVETLLLTCMYAGYMSSSMTTHSMYFPGFLGFALPVTLLFAIANFMEGGPIYNSLVWMTFLYLVVLYSITRNSSTFFKDMQTANYKNTQLNAELTSQKESAENAVLAKNRFLAAASHDLRQPLHALSLFVDALKPHLDHGEGKEIREKISQSTEALNDLLHSLLDISRLDANVVESRPKHIQVSNLIAPFEEEYRSLADAREIRFEVRVERDLVALVDPILLERVLRNLIDNAVKYTDDGTVLVSCATDGQRVRITVKDEGIGIPASQQIKAFTEFGQLDNSGTDRPKGLGLGLAIVIRLCELMDIQIEMDSVEHQGTTMTLWLEQGSINLVSSDTLSDTNFLQSLRIVAIDDEPDILDGMRRVCASWDCELVAAPDVATALSVMIEQDFEPNIILADFSLKEGESGLDGIVKIRDEFNQIIPAILVTGDTAPDRVKLATEADVTVMYKPIKSEELKQAIAQLIDLSRAP